MEMGEIIKSVNSKEDFLHFLNDLIQDKISKPTEWENKSIEDYLSSLEAWISDMEGYYSNLKIEMPTKIDWNFIATILYVGKIYE